VVGAYDRVLEAFRQAVEEANWQVLFPDKPLQSCFAESGTPTNVAFKRSLYLKDWPCRNLPKGKRVDIAIMALEEIKRGSWSLTRSTVYLNYFTVSKSTAVLFRSLHYDFVEGGQDDHPYFHVQLSDESIPQQDLRDAGFDLQLRLPEYAIQRWVVTRIPTPEMTLASVLYCLMADHWGAKIFGKFAGDVHRIQDDLPTLPFDPLKRSLQKSLAHFKSSHWFAHMRGPL